MNKLKAALILDNLGLKKWQELALLEAADLLDIKLILNCNNTKVEKKSVKNFLYYSLNQFMSKNSLAQCSDYLISNEKVVDFDSIYQDSWQFIPKDILNYIEDEDINVVIKFGMSSLRIDKSLVDIPVLSYRHGDPAKFKGRSAGFYELLYNEDKSTLTIENLTSDVDKNEILAFAESKLVHYSYKKSAGQFYQQSQFLLRKAIINIKAGHTICLDTNGKKYQSPDNFMVIGFFLLLLSKRIKHLGYGAFFEKKWKVGTTTFIPSLIGDNIIDSSSIDEFPIEAGYSFYADPFFSLDGSKVRLEALSSKSGLGDIIEVNLDKTDSNKLLLTGAHYSYPFSFLLDGEECLLPEVASHSPQYFFNLADDGQDKIFLKGLKEKRLADATLLKHSEWWYLFFGVNKFAHLSLNLWISNSVTGEFKRHPSSPICLSPSSARMAGRIFANEEGLFRFGQNNNRAYGSAVTISEITELSPEVYEEQVCGSIKINDCLGPHSIDFNRDKGIALIDYYNDEFSLFAGVRRLKALLSKN